ncbi:hypothetical protein CANCADRAFT_86389 [Tortispora caseinolytica NRRL Y-17796]|uniref:Mediator of RNA polymerase II transcription subunit 12 n=1 Tax=Tortispora caseinolytica NRRL Y-17796 TaxID=767744 RepID=A0A1E4TKZ2_9ASCO|nr:hypothetical protein CANCADRAFT_86389 [Tortispora caseinolytica NRRL Y-17796]
MSSDLSRPQSSAGPPNMASNQRPPGSRPATAPAAAASASATPVAANSSHSPSSLTRRLRNERVIYFMTPPFFLKPLSGSTQSSSTRSVYPDFFPRDASLPEDSTVQQSYNRRNDPEETNSAFSQLSPLVRSSSSLAAMSSFMVQALRRRAALETITTPSTFKPPPRVTLTEQRREAWLRDLASPTVPLRKLSRTIPHSVRDVALIDQCCAKNIPIDRALWLVKCVAANEIRGLKRNKGQQLSSNQQNEFKWKMEWTNHVIQSISTLISDEFDTSPANPAPRPSTPLSGTPAPPNSALLPIRAQARAGISPLRPSMSSMYHSTSSNNNPSSSFSNTGASSTRPWDSRFEYMILFVSQLIAENLIDLPSFLSWLTKSLKAADISSLSIYLILISLFWKRYIANPAALRKLAVVLLAQCKNIAAFITENPSEKRNLLPLYYRTGAHTLELFMSMPHAFVIPWTWNEVSGALHNIIQLSNVPSLMHDLHTISHRNCDITYFLSGGILLETQLDVLTLLDGHLISDEPLSSIVLTLLNSQLSLDLITSSILVWGASGTTYHSLDRVDFATSLLREAYSQKKEIADVLLDSLFSALEAFSLDTNSICKMLSELSALGAFKAGLYVRRLISRGILFLERNKASAKVHYSILELLDFSLLSPALKSQKGFLLKNFRSKLLNDTSASLKPDETDAQQYFLQSVGVNGPSPITALSPSASFHSRGFEWRLDHEKFYSNLSFDVKRSLANWMVEYCQRLFEANDISSLSVDFVAYLISSLLLLQYINKFVDIFELIALKTTDGHVLSLFAVVIRRLRRELNHMGILERMSLALVQQAKHVKRTNQISEYAFVTLIEDTKEYFPDIHAGSVALYVRNMASQNYLTPMSDVQPDASEDIVVPTVLDSLSSAGDRGEKSLTNDIQILLSKLVAASSPGSGDSTSESREILYALQYLRFQGNGEFDSCISNWIAVQVDPTWDLKRRAICSNNISDSPKMYPQTPIVSSNIGPECLFRICVMLIAHGLVSLSAICDIWFAVTGNVQNLSIEMSNISPELAAGMSQVLLDLMLKEDLTGCMIKHSEALSLQMYRQIFQTQESKYIIDVLFKSLTQIAAAKSSPQSLPGDMIDSITKQFQTPMSLIMQFQSELFIQRFDSFAQSLCRENASSLRNEEGPQVFPELNGRHVEISEVFSYVVQIVESCVFDENLHSSDPLTTIKALLKSAKDFLISGSQCLTHVYFFLSDIKDTFPSISMDSHVPSLNDLYLSFPSLAKDHAEGVLLDSIMLKIPLHLKLNVKSTIIQAFLKSNDLPYVYSISDLAQERDAYGETSPATNLVPLMFQVLSAILREPSVRLDMSLYSIMAPCCVKLSDCCSNVQLNYHDNNASAATANTLPPDYDSDLRTAIGLFCSLLSLCGRGISDMDLPSDASALSSIRQDLLSATVNLISHSFMRLPDQTSLLQKLIDSTNFFSEVSQDNFAVAMSFQKLPDTHMTSKDRQVSPPDSSIADFFAERSREEISNLGLLWMFDCSALEAKRNCAANTAQRSDISNLYESPYSYNLTLINKETRRFIGPLEVKPFELFEDSNPGTGENDVPISITLFDASRPFC